MICAGRRGSRPGSTRTRSAGSEAAAARANRCASRSGPATPIGGLRCPRPATGATRRNQSAKLAARERLAAISGQSATTSDRTKGASTPRGVDRSTDATAGRRREIFPPGIFWIANLRWLPGAPRWRAGRLPVGASDSRDGRQGLVCRGATRDNRVMKLPVANKPGKTPEVSGATVAGRKAAPDLVPRIQERLDAAAAAGVIGEVAALRLRAEVRRLAALRRVLRRRRPRAPLASRS